MVPIDFSFNTKNNKNPIKKINVKFCIFSNHGSKEIFHVINDLYFKMYKERMRK